MTTKQINHNYIIRLIELIKLLLVIAGTPFVCRLEITKDLY